MLKNKLLVVACIFLLLNSCTMGTDNSDEETILKHVVIQYNTLLAEGYRNLNMVGLRSVATEERAMKANYHMSALSEGKEKMDAAQESISFSNIKIISPNQAELKTREKWEYTHINIDTGEKKSPISVSYVLKYMLTRENSSWLVSNIDVEHEETLK